MVSPPRICMAACGRSRSPTEVGSDFPKRASPGQRQAAGKRRKKEERGSVDVQMRLLTVESTNSGGGRRPKVPSSGQAAIRFLTALFCLTGVLLPMRAQASTATVLGNTTYTRTTGNPNQYTTTFTAPAWIVSPYDLHIVNGDSSGNN